MKKYAAIAVLLASVGFTAQAEEKKDTPKKSDRSHVVL